MGPPCSMSFIEEPWVNIGERLSRSAAVVRFISINNIVIRPTSSSSSPVLKKKLSTLSGWSVLLSRSSLCRLSLTHKLRCGWHCSCVPASCMMRMRDLLAIAKFRVAIAKHMNRLRSHNFFGYSCRPDWHPCPSCIAKLEVVYSVWWTKLATRQLFTAR